MGKYTKLGENTQNAYGWVVAKNKSDEYYKKRNDTYKAQTGKTVHSSWNGWTPEGNSYQGTSNTRANNSQNKVSNDAQKGYGINAQKGTTVPQWAKQADLSKPMTFADMMRLDQNKVGMPSTDGGLANMGNMGNLNPVKYNYDGHVTQKTMELSNPNNYYNPELERYYDGPNANMNYRMSKDQIVLSGNNTSKTRGGEDLSDIIAKYYKGRNSPLISGYGNFVAKNGNKYTFNKDGINKDYHYTPYDTAISGNAQGQIANQELSYWNDKAFYDNGFLSEQDPGTRQLGKETTTIGYSRPSKSGGFFGKLGGLLPKLALNLIPGGQFVSAAITAGELLDPDKPGKSNVYKGNFLEGAPTFNFGNGTTNGGTNTTPNIQNPGTGGSQQTTQAMNKFNWNNVDYNVSGNNLYAPSGNLAYNKSTNTGSTQLGTAYNTYLGTL